MSLPNDYPLEVKFQEIFLDFFEGDMFSLLLNNFSETLKLQLKNEISLFQGGSMGSFIHLGS